jgi:hypothetical protein
VITEKKWKWMLEAGQESSQTILRCGESERRAITYAQRFFDGNFWEILAISSSSGRGNRRYAVR